MLTADEVQITHFQPGRVRLKVPALRGQPAAAERMGVAFRSVPGVKSLEISSVTGSVLIVYDVSALTNADTSRRLKFVLREQLPSLDADQVLSWLSHPEFPF